MESVTSGLWFSPELDQSWHGWRSRLAVRLLRHTGHRDLMWTHACSSSLHFSRLHCINWCLFSFWRLLLVSVVCRLHDDAVRLLPVCFHFYVHIFSRFRFFPLKCLPGVNSFYIMWHFPSRDLYIFSQFVLRQRFCVASKQSLTAKPPPSAVAPTPRSNAGTKAGAVGDTQATTDARIGILLPLGHFILLRCCLRVSSRSDSRVLNPSLFYFSGMFDFTFISAAELLNRFVWDWSQI